MKTIPLIILIVLTIISILQSTINHGESKGDYNAYITFISALIEWGLILWISS